MRVPVVTNSGKRILLDVVPDETVENFRSRIACVEGTSSNRESMVILGKELENDKTLSSYNVQDGSMFYSVFQDTNSIQIFVDNSLTNKGFLLKVNPSSTVKIMEYAIRMEANILDIDEKIGLTFAGQLLEDDKMISDYNIQNNSIVHLIAKMKIRVKDHSSASDLVTVEAEPGDTVESVFKKLNNILSFYPDADPYAPNFLRGKISNPRDYYKDSTLNVILFHPGPQVSYDYENAAEAYKCRIFVDETDLECKSSEIKMFTVEIFAKDTFEEIYMKIKNKLGTGFNPWKDARGQQISGNRWLWPCIGRTHGDDAILLSDIYKKSPFDLSLLRRKGCLIFCRPNVCKTITLNVGPNEKVAAVKKLIQEKGFVTLDRILSYDGTALEEDHSLLYYNIKQNSILALKGHHYDSGGDLTVYVKTLTGKEVEVKVEQNLTIEELKEKIEALEGIPIIRFGRLTYGGKQLFNHLTISNYGIPDQARIHLIMKLRGC